MSARVGTTRTREVNLPALSALADILEKPRARPLQKTVKSALVFLAFAARLRLTVTVTVVDVAVGSAGATYHGLPRKCLSDLSPPLALYLSDAAASQTQVHS